jgi:hypothetical protein
MINQSILYLPHTDCNHPKLKAHKKELGICVNWDPDLSLGIPLKKVFERVIRYDVGFDYATIGMKQTNQKIIDLVREHKPKYVLWPTMSYEILEETFQKIRQMMMSVVLMTIHAGGYPIWITSSPVIWVPFSVIRS